MGTIKRIIEWLRFRMEADLLQWTLDVECPHDPLSPCVTCDNEARALRW